MVLSIIFLKSCESLASLSSVEQYDRHFQRFACCFVLYRVCSSSPCLRRRRKSSISSSIDDSSSIAEPREEPRGSSRGDLDQRDVAQTPQTQTCSMQRREPEINASGPKRLVFSHRFYFSVSLSSPLAASNIPFERFFLYVPHTSSTNQCELGSCEDPPIRHVHQTFRRDIRSGWQNP